MDKIEELEKKLAFAIANGGATSAITRYLVNAAKEHLDEEAVIVIDETVDEVIDNKDLFENLVELEELENSDNEETE